MDSSGSNPSAFLYTKSLNVVSLSNLKFLSPMENSFVTLLLELLFDNLLLSTIPPFSLFPHPVKINNPPINIKTIKKIAVIFLI